MIPDAECDVLVVGHGAAGCLAGLALARAGQEVIVVGRGTSATELSTARVSVPEGGGDVADLLRRVGRDHGLYGSAPARNEAVTNLGTISRQDLSSVHDWLAPSRGRTAVLGLRGNECLDPDLVCRSLSLRLPDLECEPLWADPGLPATIDAGNGPLSEEALEAVDLLGCILSELGQDTVVLPPIFHGSQHAHALDRLERVSGRTVREPATPMSAPGRRLQACLEAQAVRSGCRLMKGREVRSVTFDGDLATGAVIASGLREQAIGFRAAVLAVGGPVGGGLSICGEEVIDPMRTFAVSAPSGSAMLTSALSAGLVQRNGRVVRFDDTAVRNLIPAGSCLPGMSFPLGMGLGEVASSALEAAATVITEVL